MTISAQTIVPASAEAVFSFLSDLENHWLLADRFIEVLTLERTADGSACGGVVRMHGPLGTRRTATTRVVSASPNGAMTGTAELAGGTVAHVSWRLVPANGTTSVNLAARVERASLLDRLLLAAGGRAWLERRFEAILGLLEQRFAKSV